MKSCKRSKPASSGDLEPDEEFEDEDDQSKGEFEAFKKWLDNAAPVSSNSSPSGDSSSVPAPVPINNPPADATAMCGNCSQSPCQCSLSGGKTWQLRKHNWKVCHHDPNGSPNGIYFDHSALPAAKVLC